MSRPTLADATAQLIEIGGRIDARGAAAATSGNYSAQIDDGSIAITRSGRHKGRLAPQDFMRIDAEGQPIDPGRPSAETALHLMLYRIFPETGAVLHCHSPQSVGFSRAVRADAHLFAGHEMLKAFPGQTTHETALALPIVDNSQDMAVIERAVLPLLTAPATMPAFLIRSHGLYAWGQDLDEAERVLEATEWMIAAELAERAFAEGVSR